MRSASLHACPWLSYFAPLALSSEFVQSFKIRVVIQVLSDFSRESDPRKRLWRNPRKSAANLFFREFFDLIRQGGDGEERWGFGAGGDDDGLRAGGGAGLVGEERWGFGAGGDDDGL